MLLLAKLRELFSPNAHGPIMCLFKLSKYLKSIAFFLKIVVAENKQ